jgi:Cof subfamily protein (haloacid dehalogenase superfamily)
MTGRPPRLVATDLDGTLLRDDGRISPRTERVLAGLQDAGIDVVFVTARPPRWVDVVAGAVAGHGIVICLNGAFVYDAAAGRVQSELTMPDALVAELLADLRTAVPTIAFAAERSTGFATESGFVSRHPVPSGAPVAERLEHVLDGSTGKLLARCPEVADADLVARVTAVVDGRATVSDSGAVGLAEIGGPGVTKAATLAGWAGERGIGPAEVWAFGDMPNDLPMLRWAGRAFAVANAHPSVLAAADVVCGSNMDDGVACALEQLLT